MRDDIHPEELLVPGARRVLGDAEEADLRVHLARCPGCALQVSLRADLDAALAPTDVDYDVGARAVERLLSSRSCVSLKPPRIRSVAEPEVVSARLAFGRFPFGRLPLAARVAAVLLTLLGTGVGASALVLGTHGRLWGKVAPAEAPVSAEHARGVPTPRGRTVATASPAPLPDPLPAARGEGEQSVAPALAAEVAPRSLHRETREAVRAVASAPVPAPELPAPEALVPPPAAAALEPMAPPREGAADSFVAAESARREGRAREALRAYGRLEAGFAGSREGMTALVLMGQMLLDELGAPTEALASFERYLLEQPSGALAEEARVGRAQALWRLGRASEEAAAWNELLARHPRSLHAALARGRLAALANHGD